MVGPGVGTSHREKDHEHHDRDQEPARHAELPCCRQAKRYLQLSVDYHGALIGHVLANDRLGVTFPDPQSQARSRLLTQHLPSDQEVLLRRPRP